MKKTLSSILFALCAALASPAAWSGAFAAEKDISLDASLGSQFPEVAYSGNSIHIVWVGYAPGLQGDIYYRRSTNNGSTFDPVVNLSANATAGSGNDRPQVTALGNGTVIVGWNSNNDTGAIYARRSTNGGTNFEATTTLAGVEGGLYSRITDLFVDSANRVHLAYYTNEDTAGVSGMVHHRMSCDSGASWGTDVRVTDRLVDGDFDNEQPRIAESGGKLHIVFRSSANGNPQGGWPPYAVLSKTGSVSGCTVGWSYPARRVTTGFPLEMNSTYRPEVFGDAGGTLHAAWWSNAKGANVHYRRGNPATGTLGAPAAISAFGIDHLEPGALSSTPGQAAGGFQSPPGLVGDGTRAFLAYQKNTSATAQGFENGPIFLRESADNGGTWGAELNIAGTNQGTTPRLAIGGGGQNVAIVWADIRTAPTPHVYFRLYNSGVVSGPSFSIAPSPFNFGNRAVGTSGNTVLTLQNTGTAGTVNGVAGTGDFSLVSTTCGGALAGGASCSITARFSPSALGTRNGSITVSTNAFDSPTQGALTGNGVAGTFSNNVSAVITGYYETILSRPPDGPGLAYWQGEATRVQGLGADVREVFFTMAIQFFNSTEYLNRATSNTQYLTDLYRTFFLREPDAPGLAYWESQLSQGMDRGALLTNFLFSTEFSNQMTALFGSASVRAEINVVIDLYRGILGVLPDSGGFNYWLGRIRTAQCTGGNAVIAEVDTISSAFITSPEYSQRETARPGGIRQGMHVGDLYNAFLRRGADLSGYQYWTGQLNGGQTRDFVRSQFLQSPEFQNRVTQVIATPCIP